MLMCRLEDQLTEEFVSGRFDEQRSLPIGRWFLWFITGICALLLVSLLCGCTTVKTIQANVDEDITAILGRLHVDAQEFINHPERWSKVVDSLCADGMVLAKDCVQLKAIIKARDIATGLRESRYRPPKRLLPTRDQNRKPVKLG